MHYKCSIDSALIQIAESVINGGDIDSLCQEWLPYIFPPFLPKSSKPLTLQHLKKAVEQEIPKTFRFCEPKVDIPDFNSTEEWESALNEWALGSGIDPDRKPKLLEAIKSSDRPWDTAIEKFSPEKRVEAYRFIRSYQNLQFDLEEELDQFLDAQRPWLSEDLLDGYESGEKDEMSLDSFSPVAEIIVEKNRVVVHALKYAEGFSKMLPRGGKYQGKGTGTWVYPKTSIESLKAMGLPIIYHPGCK